jgi:hypothetical protein
VRGWWGGRPGGAVRRAARRHAASRQLEAEGRRRQELLTESPAARHRRTLGEAIEMLERKAAEIRQTEAVRVHHEANAIAAAEMLEQAAAQYREERRTLPQVDIDITPISASSSASWPAIRGARRTATRISAPS